MSVTIERHCLMSWVLPVSAVSDMAMGEAWLLVLAFRRLSSSSPREDRFPVERPSAVLRGQEEETWRDPGGEAGVFRARECTWAGQWRPWRSRRESFSRMLDDVVAAGNVERHAEGELGTWPERKDSAPSSILCDIFRLSPARANSKRCSAWRNSHSSPDETTRRGGLNMCVHEARTRLDVHRSCPGRVASW